MSVTAATTTEQPAANDAAIAPDAAELATRAGVPAPEAKLTDEAAAIMPPPVGKVDLPTPPVTHAATPPAPTAEAANDALGGHAMRIEQNLSTFIGDRLPAGMAEGLMVDITLANSNAITSEGQKGLHDIAIAFKGGKLEDPKTAEKLAEYLRAALREHPAFAQMSFAGLDTKIEHMMRCSIMALEPEKLDALLTPQPRKHVTYIASPALAANDASYKPTHGHCTGGAGCAHCAAPKTHADAAEVTAQADAAVQPATPIAPPAPTVEAPKPEAAPEVTAATPPEASVVPTPAVEQPAVAAAKPEIQSVAPPVTQVTAPAIHQGHVAANDKNIALAG